MDKYLNKNHKSIIMWIVICDNTKGKNPEGFILTTLYNFVNFLKQYSDVEVFLLSEKKLKAIDIISKNGLKVIEKTINISNLEGIVISLTISAVDSIFVDENLKSDFLSIIKNLKEKAPILIFSAKIAFNKFNENLRKYNLFFEPRRGVNWFNINLRNRLKQIIKK